MLTRVNIENFRGFEKLQVPSLRPVNLIVGRNSAGKTAFLEAIFIALGNSPQSVLRLRRWRGMGEGAKITFERGSYEALWKDLFYLYDQKSEILIELAGIAGPVRCLKVSYRQDQTLTLPLGDRDLDEVNIAPVTFEWVDATGNAIQVRPNITSQGLELPMGGPALPGAFFASFVIPNAEENANRFSALSKINKERLFIESLQKEFPWIANISLEIEAGTPQLFATISGVEAKVPVANVSGGVNKLISILLAIANMPKGIILVDEIENGFYYDRLTAIWSLLLRFSQEFNAQIFATTHSLECIRSLQPLLEDNPQSFSFIRLQRKLNSVQAKVFSGKDLGRAIDQNIEVR